MRYTLYIVLLTMITGSVLHAGTADQFSHSNVCHAHISPTALLTTNTPKVTTGKMPEKVEKHTKKAPLIISTGDEVTIPTRDLVQRLQTNDVQVLLYTIDLIETQDTGSKIVLDAFAHLLQHTNTEIREAIIDCAFGFDTVKPLLPALAKCLYDPEESIRDDAIDVIADIETRDMITVLVENMTNKFVDVRENCDFYLAFWSDKEFTEPEQWFAWWGSNRTTFVFE